jgi:hypothetical protein
VNAPDHGATLHTVEEPFSLRALISVTLSPSASNAPLES